ncbi:MAG: formylglycine-generating enzyme family protein [Bacteroidia bacterium]|nr:formylglycine-generating enzyme family protein [Bacteroidia bacterium]NNF30901.1 SUMF1/EgtB/PvdO family nonheme iron enzyme [Flavobacteriaceae bacterium]MBT8275393.1 formylglycine-generating enzyme family protein [Bacteroidia bacterium]NNJ81290.1 SUMF1/EgtB/PvdO family nonheme iron enzyme [Flavobacteriaceae bacterium]NNK54514.1 SUMF1/EgtB/PvdO family nonheme iron enzyme [Flavobacteriaceae bacterium]
MKSSYVLKICIAVIGIIVLTAFHSTKNENDMSKYKSAEMVFIQGGSFFMGQVDGEADEKPSHKVNLSDFYIGKFEVSVADYRLFCETTNRIMPKEPKWGWYDDHPIVNTTWYDAIDFITWLNAETGENFRLPSEAEFEYVIRNGGKEGVYPWAQGKPINENIADESYGTQYSGKRIWNGYTDGFVHTSPIGAYPPNEVGVCDINGNVWEWVSDWFQDYSDAIKQDPEGPESGKHKVGRGGSFNADPWHCRSASRSYVLPSFTGPGFRLARDID